MLSEAFTNWIEIDLGAIRGNIQQVQKVAGKPVLAVLKANAYGHGLLPASRAAVAAGARILGVARVEEAHNIRLAGINSPLLVLGYTSPFNVADAMAGDITLSITDWQTARDFSEKAKPAGGRLKVHIEVDSGMGRLGVPAEDGVELVRWVSAQKEFDVEGVYTHFARADEPGVNTTRDQMIRFDAFVQGLNGAGLRPPLVHAANSAAALNHAESRLDMVRPGIAIYGLDPSDESPLPEGFQPALSWKTRLVSVKNFPSGSGIGYGHRYFTRFEERIGVIATGYADGFRRTIGNQVLIRGKKVAVVGGVCMDQCMVQLDSAPEAQAGDEVVIIGKQGGVQLTAEEVASGWGTINYEVVCGLAARVPRVYRG